MGSTLLGIMNIGKQSITNNQIALNVVSNNIANMNTENYTKQRVDFAALPAYDCYNWCSKYSNLKIGHGAEIVGISNKRSEWVDNYFRGQNTPSGYYNQIGTMASNLENLLNDELSDGGLQARFSEFFKASEALTGDPTNTAYKIAFVNAAQNISDMLNNMSKTVNGYINQAIGEFGNADSFNNSMLVSKVDELNTKLQQLADANQAIIQNSSGGSVASDLTDKQNAILDELSSMIPLTTTTNPNGTVNVYIDGQAVVKGGDVALDVKAVQTTDPDNPIQIQLVDDEGNIKAEDVSSSFEKSSIGAILDMASPDAFGYKSVLSELDKLANAFAQEMNRIQTQADANGTPLYIGPDGTLVESTTPLFTTTDGSTTFTAANIKINSDIVKNPSLVATARIDTTQADYDNRAVGNTGNMDLFNNLAKGKLSALSATTPPGEGVSITDFLAGLVSKIGSEVQSINNAKDAQDAVTEQAIAERDVLYGVDLDEELADLIRFQRSYEASARVFNVANELMQLMVQLGK